MNESVAMAGPTGEHRRRRYLNHRRWLVLLAVLMVAVLLAESLGRGPASWLFPPKVHVTLGGQSYLVPEGELKQNLARNPANSDAFLDERLRSAEAGLVSAIHTLFDSAEARIPDYLDWHYSLRGNLTRAMAWGISKVPGRDGADASSAFRKRVLGATWSTELQALERKLKGQYGAAIEAYAATSRRWIERQLQAHRVTGPVTSDYTLDLDQAFDTAAGELFEGHQAARQVFASGVASAGAVALSHQLARQRAQRATARAALSTGSRAGARAGSRVAGAAASTPCLASGPAAPACAASVFLGTLVATELAIIHVDKLLKRGDHEQALRDLLAAERQALLARVAAASRRFQAAQAGLPERLVAQVRPKDLL